MNFVKIHLLKYFIQIAIKGIKSKEIKYIYIDTNVVINNIYFYANGLGNILCAYNNYF